MSDVAGAKGRRTIMPVLAMALLSSLALGCGRTEQVQAGTPFPAPVSTPDVSTSSFQGAVTSFDPQSGRLDVAVQIVWTPVLKAHPHERHVHLDSRTLWEPSTAVHDVLVGDEVHVEAVDVADGTWRAEKVLLLDID